MNRTRNTLHATAIRTRCSRSLREFCECLAGFASSLAITVLVAGVFLSDPHRAATQGDHFSGATVFDMDGFSVALGIYILSLAGHACLPSVYAQMEKPEEFERMLNWSFGIMFVVYTLIAVFGYLAFAPATIDILIMKNLVEWPGGAVVKVVAGLVVVKSWTTVSPLVGILAEIPEELLGLHGGGAAAGHGGGGANPNGGGIVVKEYGADGRPWLGVAGKKRLLRSALCAAATGIAYFAVAELDVVEAVTGTLCTMLTSLIFPVYFYLVLRGKKEDDVVGAVAAGEGGLAPRWRAWCWAVIVLSVATCALLSVGDVHDILHRIRTGTSSSN